MKVLKTAMISAAVIVAAGWVAQNVAHRTMSQARLSSDFEAASDVTRDLWQFDKTGTCDITHDEATQQESSSSVKFVAADGARCELVPKMFPDLAAKFLREPYGVDRWYAVSVRVEPTADSEGQDFPSTVILQWHSSRDRIMAENRGRGPPLALRIKGNEWVVTYGWDERFRSNRQHIASLEHYRTPVTYGEWTDWLFRVRWSHKSDGLTEIWKNGEHVVSYHGPNAYNDLRGVYLKLGVYHPPGNMTVYMDNVEIGPNRP